MAKIDIDLVAEVLKHNEFDQQTVERIVKELARVAEQAAEEAAAEREPPVKKQFVVGLSDPRGEVPDIDLIGWVFQIPETDNPATTIERLVRAAHNFNLSPRGRKHPVKSIGEACEVVAAKYQKEQNLSVKTKLPVTILKTDNVLPDDEGSKITMSDLRDG